MKKKVVAMFLAAVMALSLVACGNKTDNGGSGDASGTETIKLGGVGPLTGGYANYGLSVQHGAELAVKEINAAGGVNGKQLEVNFQDSQGDPESAVAAYGATPDQFAADAYDAVYTVKAAVEAANGSTSGADLAAVMPTITVEGVTGTMTWSADGNTNKAASAILYKNGVGTLFGQDNANDAAGAESGDAADTAADAEA